MKDRINYGSWKAFAKGSFLNYSIEPNAERAESRFSIGADSFRPDTFSIKDVAPRCTRTKGDKHDTPCQLRCGRCRVTGA